MSDQQARQDENQFPALIAHSGTAGTSETIRLVADSSGNLGVNLVGTEPIELVAGTINRVSTVGTLELGTVVGATASGGTPTTNPVLISGTDATGTVYAPLVSSAGALTIGTITGVGVVSNLTNGSVRMTVGTLTTGSLSNVAMLNAGTIDTVTSVSNLVKGTITRIEGGTLGEVTNLTSGSVRMTVGTLTTGTLQNLVSGTINALASGTITGGTVSTNLLPLVGVVLTTAVTIGTVGTLIPASALANRKSLLGYNTGTATVYLGGTGVTASTGIPAGTGAFTPAIDLGTATLSGIGSTVGGTIVVMEVS